MSIIKFLQMGGRIYAKWVQPTDWQISLITNGRLHMLQLDAILCCHDTGCQTVEFIRLICQFGNLYHGSSKWRPIAACDGDHLGA